MNHTFKTKTWAVMLPIELNEEQYAYSFTHCRFYDSEHEANEAIERAREENPALDSLYCWAVMLLEPGSVIEYSAPSGWIFERGQLITVALEP